MAASPRTAGRYQRVWLGGDLVAGLTVWAVLVPEALAYATIAGVSPVVGLYAAPPALVLYAVFGSSKHLVVGPMAATAALSAATVADLVSSPDDVAAMTAALALTTGLVALVAGLLRFGFLANFISEPVLKGFIVGLAMTIIVGQVPKLFGIPKGEGDFFEQLWDVLSGLGDTHGTTLAVGVASLAVVLGLRRFLPVVPGSLVAVAFGIAVVHLFGLDDEGVAIVGPIDGGLPSFGLPDGLGWDDYTAAIAASVGIMLLGFVEGLGAAKEYAAKNGYSLDTNRELVGLGAANIGSGLSSGMVVNGSLSKTAVNGAAGARTQVSGLVVAVLTVITLLFLTGLFEELPEATLAAVVIAALVELVDFRYLADLYRIYTRRLGSIYGAAARPDFIAATAALIGVLVFDTLPGLFIGVGLSMVLLLYRASRPHVTQLGRVPGTTDQFADRDRHPENQPVTGIVVVRVEGGLFFANADAVRSELERLGAQPDVRALVLDAEAIPYTDVTGVRTLREVATALGRDGVAFAIAGDIGQVRDVIGREAVDGEPVAQYRTVETAVEALSEER